MQAPFDAAAPTYDEDFTHSRIGRLQRQRVWAHLESILPQLAGKNILELNCGTGEDALWFAKRGYHVLATDVSEAMLDITRNKAAADGLGDYITIRRLDLVNGIGEGAEAQKFDLIFSNFGGLNCLPPDKLQLLLEGVHHRLKPNGRFVAVIMPKYCLWELFYFLIKLVPRKAFRRFSKQPAIATVYGHEVKTWYYNPATIKKALTPFHSIMGMVPIGFWLPPSYLEPFFNRWPGLLSALNSFEKWLNHSLLSSFSDHFLVDAEAGESKG